MGGPSGPAAFLRDSRIRRAGQKSCLPEAGALVLRLLGTLLPRTSPVGSASSQLSDSGVGGHGREPTLEG